MDWHVLRLATEDVIHWLNSKGISRSRIYSDSDVFVSMNKTSSPGFPFTRTGTLTKRQAWRKHFNTLRHFWKSGYIDHIPVFTGSQKEEMRTREKFENDNLRLFYAGCLHHYYFDVKLFGCFYDQMLQHSWEIGFWPGSSHYFGGWDFLVRQMFSSDNFVWVGDLSKFDTTQCYEILLEAVVPVLREFAPSDEPERSEAALFFLISSFVLRWDGYAVFLDKGNKSGIASTIFVNMILQLVIKAYTCRKQTILLDDYVHNFCGDDSVFSVPQWLSGFDPYMYYSNFGLVVKYSKTVSVETFEYLSKGVVPLHGMYYPVADANKMLCSLAEFTEVSSGAYLAKLNSLIMECAWSPTVSILIAHRDFVLAHAKPDAAWKDALLSVFSLAKCRSMYDYRQEVQSIKIQNGEDPNCD